MVEVIKDVSQRIEFGLNYLFDEWSAVPGYAREFASWGPEQQLVFVHEWGIRESWLEQLRDYANAGLLTTEQHERYEQVLELVARHRSVIAQLLAA